MMKQEAMASIIKNSGELFDPRTGNAKVNM